MSTSGSAKRALLASDLSADARERRPEREPTGYILGPYRLDLKGDVLFYGDAGGETPVNLGRRAAAVLHALVARPMVVVTKDELFAAGWPGLAVEDSNLAVQIGGLRKALVRAPGSAKWIETMHGRGYRYIGPVSPQYGPDRGLTTIADFPIPAPHNEPTPRQGPPGLAVLPFRSLNDGTADDYFGEGIVEDIIAALASLRVLTVISRNSTLVYRRQEADPRRVGRELDVRYVVSGSVRRDGERLRVSAELADCNENAVIWARRYETPVEQMFDVQDSIALQIASTVVPQIESAELARLRRKHPESLDAYDLVLRARDIMAQMALVDASRREFDRAGNLLRDAIKMDPDYAMPYAMMAEWHSLMVGQGWTADKKMEAELADRMAQKALARDPANPYALAQHGHNRSYLFRDYRGAMAAFDHALGMSPSNPTAWILSSLTCSYIGEANEAIRRAHRALRLSPFDPLVGRYHAHLGLAYYTAEQYAEAIHWGCIAMDKVSGYTAVPKILAMAYAASGKTEEARLMATRVLELEPQFRLSTYIPPYEHEDLRTRILKHMAAAGLPA